MPSEFELIRRYFRRPTHHTVLAGGDDAAVVAPRAGMELVISTDMLVAGTHFLPDTEPQALGWKTLAVNVSDLAAMGAQPRWALLAAALPQADEAWIAAFAEGFFACAQTFSLDVIGGDTTRGPLNLTPTVIGEVPAGEALRRGAARAGDEVWISGQPGRAALGLAQLQGRVRLDAAELPGCLEALHRPRPRVELGLALRGLAHAAIDVSDGVAADFGHILEESGLAGELWEGALPLGNLLRAGADAGLARECVLAGGDDYELLFTCDPAARGTVEALGAELGLALTRIGRMPAGEAGTLRLLDADGKPVELKRRGYDHFA